MKKIIIAIDGNSGCGKSTTAKMIAKRLSYRYIDSGAMYRAVTLFFIKNHINIEDKDEINQALEQIEINFIIDPTTKENLTLLNGKNVEDKIRTLQITQHVSEVSRISEVRSFLVEEQRRMGKEKEIVMDGRDIGTVVFPDAELKIFMTADLKVRASRRQIELKEKNEVIDYQVVLDNLAHRDYLDSTRKEGALKKAKDAVEIDTTNLTIKDQVNRVYELFQEVSAVQNQK